MIKVLSIAKRMRGTPQSSFFSQRHYTMLSIFCKPPSRQKGKRPAPSNLFRKPRIRALITEGFGGLIMANVTLGRT
ncbi:MAG: hypothetical protein MR219_11380, partial [Clostridiales bacterium]|nr:hypothetical protein [Clostridiales bacterium]